MEGERVFVCHVIWSGWLGKEEHPKNNQEKYGKWATDYEIYKKQAVEMQNSLLPVL